MEHFNWTDSRSIPEMIAQARSRAADRLVFESPSGGAGLKVESGPCEGIAIYCDPADAARSPQMLQALPAQLALIAALPDRDLAVTIALSTLEAHPDLISRSQSPAELVVRLAAVTDVTFHPADRPAGEHPLKLPSLTTGTAGPEWLRAVIRDLSLPKFGSTCLSALKAGLYLLNDFFDDSHERSQSLEGIGRHHTGDYWHAILHRREPDYGNAKYWFRHVGRHPSFADLATTAQTRVSSAGDAVTETLQRWQGRLLPQGTWDPFAFVDLCQAAADDNELRRWCEQVQYDEMLLLLLWTYAEGSQRGA